jgi:hypothetical protein
MGFSDLGKMSQLGFNDTDLCEPSDAVFQEWLVGISELERTGVICP